MLRRVRLGMIGSVGFNVLGRVGFSVLGRVGFSVLRRVRLGMIGSVGFNVLRRVGFSVLGRARLAMVRVWSLACRCHWHRYHRLSRWRWPHHDALRCKCLPVTRSLRSRAVRSRTREPRPNWRGTVGAWALESRTI